MRVVAIVICQNHVPDLVQLSAHEPQMGSRTGSRPITQRMFEYRVSLRYSNVAFGNHVPMGFNGGTWGIFLSHVWGHRRVAAWGYYWQDNEDHINDFFDEPQAGEENSRVGLKDGFFGLKKHPWLTKTMDVFWPYHNGVSGDLFVNKVYPRIAVWMGKHVKFLSIFHLGLPCF